MENLSIKATGDFSSVNKGLKDLSQNLKETVKNAETAGAALETSLTKGTEGASSSLKDLISSVTSGGGIDAITEQVGPLVDSFKDLKSETGSNKEALKQMISGGMGMIAVEGLIFAAGLAMKYLFEETKYVNHSVEQTKEETEKYGKALKDITESVSQEQAKVLTLVTALQSQNLSRKEQLGTLKELQSINPKYFGDLTIEEGLVRGLTKAYDKYKESLIATIQNKLDQKKLEDVLAKINTLEEDRLNNQFKLKQIEQDRKDLQAKGADAGMIAQIDLQKEFIGRADDMNSLLTQRDAILKNMSDRQFAGQTSTDTSKEKKDLESISDVLAKMHRELDYLNTKELTFKTDETKQKLSTIESTIENLIKKFKLTSESPVVIDLIAEMGQIKTATFLKQLSAQARNLRTSTGGLDMQLPIEIVPTGGVKDYNPFGNKDPFVSVGNTADASMEKMIKRLRFNKIKEGFQDGLSTSLEGLRFPELKALYKESEQRIAQYADNVSGIITNSFTSGFSQLGKSIGEALTGAENPIGGFFAGIASILASSLKQLGESIIASSTLIAGIKKALNAAFAGNPVLGVVLGVGLIAMGAVLESSLPRFASGTNNFAGGAAIVGEMGPEIVQMPAGSKVISNNRTQSFASNSNVPMVIRYDIKGKDLQMILERQTQFSTRNNG